MILKASKMDFGKNFLYFLFLSVSGAIFVNVLHFRKKGLNGFVEGIKKT